MELSPRTQRRNCHRSVSTSVSRRSKNALPHSPLARPPSLNPPLQPQKKRPPHQSQKLLLRKNQPLRLKNPLLRPSQKLSLLQSQRLKKLRPLQNLRLKSLPSLLQNLKFR